MHQDLSTSLRKKSLNSGIKKDGARLKNKVLIFHLSFFIHTYNHFKIDGAKRIKKASQGLRPNWNNGMLE